MPTVCNAHQQLNECLIIDESFSYLVLYSLFFFVVELKHWEIKEKCKNFHFSCFSVATEYLTSKAISGL
jgi:hypothetical protein